MKAEKLKKEDTTAATLRHFLSDVLTRLCEIDQKIDHIIENIHDALYRRRGPGAGGTG